MQLITNHAIISVIRNSTELTPRARIEYILKLDMAKELSMVEVMSKVFEVEITEIIDKYNFHSEKNQALMILDNKY